MEIPKKRFAILVLPVALMVLASFLAAQTHKPCEKTCQQIYADSVKSCHGDQACLAAARGAVLNCLNGCSQPR